MAYLFQCYILFLDTDAQVLFRKTGLFSDGFAVYAKQQKVKADHVTQGGEIIQLFSKEIKWCPQFDIIIMI